MLCDADDDGHRSVSVGSDFRTCGSDDDGSGIDPLGCSSQSMCTCHDDVLSWWGKLIASPGGSLPRHMLGAEDVESAGVQVGPTEPRGKCGSEVCSGEGSEQAGEGSGKREEGVRTAGKVGQDVEDDEIGEVVGEDDDGTGENEAGARHVT